MFLLVQVWRQACGAAQEPTKCGMNGQLRRPPPQAFTMCAADRIMWGCERAGLSVPRAQPPAVNLSFR